MRGVAIGVLLAILSSAAPVISRSTLPNCCKNERHCPMHQRQSTGCQMGACQRDAASTPAIGKATLCCDTVVVALNVVELLAIGESQSLQLLKPQPAVPPPRA